MLRLHGFSSSNYYNVVKLTLLEKAVPFEEVLVYSGAGEKYRPDYLAMSPLGKVPCLETAEGFVSESRAICEYLEEVHPEPALYPKAPFARAKERELVQVLDLYVDLPARRVLRNFFTRSAPPPKIADEVRSTLQRGVAALVSLAGERLCDERRFGALEVSAANHLPMAQLVARTVLDFDPLAGAPVLEAYLARLMERPTVKRVRDDRDADLPSFAAHLQQLYSA